MRESCTYGFVRGALSNERPYRDRDSAVPTSESQIGIAADAWARRHRGRG